DEHDDRLADDALVLARVPVLGDDPGLDEARDVALEREVHVVGLEAVRDGAALVPGGAVRRLPRDALAVLRLGPQLLGRVVARLGHGEPDERERRGLGGAVAARVAAAGPVDGGRRAGGEDQGGGCRGSREGDRRPEASHGVVLRRGPEGPGERSGSRSAAVIVDCRGRVSRDSSAAFPLSETPDRLLGRRNATVNGGAERRCPPEHALRSGRACCGTLRYVAPRGDGLLNHDLMPGEKGPQDACGVFGVWAPGEEVAKLAYFGLYALQHRGQESAGIATSNGEQILVYKDMGLVSQVFDETALNAL